MNQAELKALIHYDPESGVFRRVRTGNTLTSVCTKGYYQARVGKKHYLLHRLAFLYMQGAFPEAVVDHINGIRTDNRWCNLRALSRTENCHNIGGSMSNNKLGVLGVHYDARNGKYRALITVAGKKIHLGRFLTQEAARQAYLAAKDKYHPTHRRLDNRSLTPPHQQEKPQ